MPRVSAEGRAQAFDRHFRMGEADAAAYAMARLPMFARSRSLDCEEIGDGNINYVFRVRDPESGASAIIKHADEGSRTSKRLIGFDRSRIEAEILRLEARYVPWLVPEVYDFDPVMCCISMQDLSDHRILRQELLERRTFPRLAMDVSDFLVETTVPTMDGVMKGMERKEMIRRYINPALCDITEQLVFTDPYTNASGRNSIGAPNEEFVRRELYSDSGLKTEAAKLKNGFTTNAQALIHGDLHTGSIFVKDDSTKVIDPEFAFFGPIGYDAGNFTGNLCLAWINAFVEMAPGEERDGYLSWVEGAIVETVEQFKEKFPRRFRELATDPMATAEGYVDWLLARVLEDTAGCAGLEMCRRTVGFAKVKELTSIKDATRRALAERISIYAAKDLIMGRSGYDDGRDYVATLHEHSERLSADPNARRRE